jgi:cobalt-zinc-cadmium efflux system outer membrane protein
MKLRNITHAIAVATIIAAISGCAARKPFADERLVGATPPQAVVAPTMQPATIAPPSQIAVVPRSIGQPAMLTTVASQPGTMTPQPQVLSPTPSPIQPVAWQKSPGQSITGQSVAGQSISVPPGFPTPAPDTSGTLPTPNMPNMYSLPDLISIAEQVNPSIRRARSEIDSAKGKRVQAGLYPNPDMETNNPELWAGRASQVNFGWEQDVIVKGKMRLDKAAADQNVQSETAQFVLERMRALTDIRRAYYSALAARMRVENTQMVLGIAQRARDAAQQLSQAGERTLTDVLLLNNEYEHARVNAENAQTNFAAALKQLAAVTGTPNRTIEDVQGDLLAPLPMFDEEAMRDFVMNGSAYMATARANVLRRQIMLNRAEVDPYPNLRFGPSYAANTANSGDQLWMSILFKIPVWDFNQGNIRAAHAELQGSIADLEAGRNDRVVQLAKAYADFKTASLFSERINTLILPNARQAQELVQEGYLKGQLDVNRLLEAQRAYLEATSDQIDASEQAWRSAAELAGFLQIEQFPY